MEEDHADVKNIGTQDEHGIVAAMGNFFKELILELKLNIVLEVHQMKNGYKMILSRRINCEDLVQKQAYQRNRQQAIMMPECSEEEHKCSRGPSITALGKSLQLFIR